MMPFVALQRASAIGSPLARAFSNPSRKSTSDSEDFSMGHTSPRFRVFATANIGDEAIEVLRQRGYEVEVYDRVEPPPKQLIIEKVRSGIDGLITTLRDRIDAEVFEAGKGTLKVVAQDAVGFDNINRADANRYKVPFTNTPDVLTEATAEFALFILGCVARKLYPSERLVRENRWGAWHPFLPFLGDEVCGKTIGVVGLGRIGQAFVKKAVGLDVNFLCYEPGSQRPDFLRVIQEALDLRYRLGFPEIRHTIRHSTFEELLRHSDFVTLHVPLLREGEAPTPTFHLMNEKTLSLMKPTAYLINTSRGPVVDENALVEAIKSGTIAGAALDVFEKEPLPADSPLRDPALEDRVRLFSHFASAGRTTRLSTNPAKGMAGRCIQGLIDVLEGNHGGDPVNMPYVVNKEAFRHAGGAESPG
jgi:glyoxylate reductase